MTVTAAPPAIGSVLIVDDSLVQRSQVLALCGELGVPAIYQAADGQEALALLDMLVLPPELMVIDLEMPGMDGVELIQALHARQLQIPLVIVSSRDSVLIQTVETMALGLGLPVVAGLRKPLERLALRTALEAFSHLDGDSDGETPPSGFGELAPDEAGALAAAIDDGEIDVHYQPKVDMLTGGLRGVEALARWRRADGRRVRPDRFVALAEREGLIGSLTDLVLERAFAQAARWNAEGLRMAMAVNLSPRLLGTPSLVEHLEERVASHGLTPDQVVLELTESSVVGGDGAALGVLARLRLKGMRLSIDDYGTGFSSLQQLARIPFTELKIDRAFVHGAARRKNLRVILQSALDMARQLGLATVAEGIETLEDWRLVQESGCSVGQGFLVARPMPAADFPDWLARHRARVGDLQPVVRPDPT